MTDKRTKNAEIFRDTERRYTSDPALMSAVQQSTKNQVFIAETEKVVVPSAYKIETAKVVVKSDGLESADAALIKDIILGEVSISSENIRIFEVK